MTDSFAGIAPGDVPMFIVAQLLGALAGPRRHGLVFQHGAGPRARRLLRNASDMHDLPNLDAALARAARLDRLEPRERATHTPRILLLYGSLRERSFSRL